MRVPMTGRRLGAGTALVVLAIGDRPQATRVVPDAC